MGLNATLKKAATTALTKTGDLKEACVYTHIPEVTGAVAFDATNDTVANTSTEYTFDAVLASLTKAEVDWLGAQDAVTQKLIVNYDALPVKPTQKDNVVIDGDTWEVRRTKGVPGNSVHVIFLRRS